MNCISANMCILYVLWTHHKANSQKAFRTYIDRLVSLLWALCKYIIKSKPSARRNAIAIFIAAT